MDHRATPIIDEPQDSEEPWLAAVRRELRAVRAPESLRARITAMLAVERQLSLRWEPDDGPRR